MRVCTQSTVLVLVCLLLTCLPVRAQQASDITGLVAAATEPFADAKAGKVLRAHRIVGDPPAVDGRLQDEAWQRAASIDDFIQWEPDNMAPLSERTVAQVAYDDRHIYIAVRAFESVPGGVTAGLGRRDTFLPTDHLEIGFDPRHDHQTSYVFQVNPSGVQGDFVHFDDQRVDRDYDAVWEVRTQVTSDGWTAEFQIPFSQMRFSIAPDQPTVWGFMVRREIHRRGEQGQWVGRPRGEQGNVSRWGHLVFEAPFVSPPRRLELLPYVLGGRTEIPASAEADQRGGAGLDLRYGIGSAATLSATVNPDFGQVEQDPAVLNLSVFETFFPEKRPFFLEDSRTFVSDQGPFRLFHSRRIGRRPGYLSLESGDTVVDSARDDDPWCGQNHRQDRRVDVWGAHGTDGSRVRRCRGGPRRNRHVGRSRARRPPHRADDLLQRRAAAARRRRVIQCRRPHHGRDAGGGQRRVHRRHRPQHPLGPEPMAVERFLCDHAGAR